MTIKVHHTNRRTKVKVNKTEFFLPMLMDWDWR